ncbi:MAG: L,D-transpeptidase family protein [Sulfitobacter sp.]
MRRVIYSLLSLILIAGVIVGYTAVMARIGSGTPPAMLAADQQADEILVIKSTREMHLLRDGETLRSYDISLGAAPTGHKLTEGDERTPEGRYIIDWRNPSSIAHLSLHISYPNPADKAAARDQNLDPGGNIMIHGLPNGWGFLQRMHLAWDWTNGCIAVTNAQMRDIWSRVPNNTPILIVDSL